jgi:ABC-type multidrug transport system fused ATPase/permease subunit
LAIASVVIGSAWALAHHEVGSSSLTSVWVLALAFGATVEQVCRMIPELQHALGAWGRVQLFTAAPQETSGSASPIDGDILVRGLTFRYPNSNASRAALNNVTLTLARGRSYAVIGRTGSGKSTLAKAISRAVDVPRGTVFFGGRDLLDIDLEVLRRWVAIVPQHTDILAGTLIENITLFNPELAGAAAQAVHELGLDSWVAELPAGLYTTLGDGGQVLSAGQEQLVAIARVLVGNPRVVILDEAMARMDALTEMRVHTAADRLFRDRIGIVIAHRPSTVRQCTDVIALEDGVLVEAAPLQHSERFAQLLAAGRYRAPGEWIAPITPESDLMSPDLMSPDLMSADGLAPEAEHKGFGSDGLEGPVTSQEAAPGVRRERSPSRTVRETIRLITNDPKFGLGAVGVFLLIMFLGVEGPVLPTLWARLIAGQYFWPAVLIAAALILTAPLAYLPGRWYSEWWQRQMLRISLRLVYCQTGSRRVSQHTPAEVVAQTVDIERVVNLADNIIDQAICIFILVSTTVVSHSFVPALFFAGTLTVSAAAASAFAPVLERSAQRTITSRAQYAMALVSSMSAVRTIKLAGAASAIQAHLAGLDRQRSESQRREATIQVWARSTPTVFSGLLPIGAWILYLAGHLSAGATLVAISTLGAARVFAWTTASLVSNLPSAQVWTRRATAMCGTAEYSTPVTGVDVATGTASAPQPAPRTTLNQIDLINFGAVHDDGSISVRQINLKINRGELVLIIGPVGAGKSSLLRALAGIVRHTGEIRWNNESVRLPEEFLRPNRVGFVAQLPRVFSGTVSDNVRLDHDVDVLTAVSLAQLDRDLAATSRGLETPVGHKGTQLSGGQLQRLALARALAPCPELLVADDISSALDLDTELALWASLRARGMTIVGSTTKRLAVMQADRVLVMLDGCEVDQGSWSELEGQWGHLVG